MDGWSCQRDGCGLQRSGTTLTDGTRDRPPTSPTVLLCGAGWFPDQAGGLNRYLRDLQQALEGKGIYAASVVVGPAADAGPNVVVAASGQSTLFDRVCQYLRCTNLMANRADLVDSHFALYSAVPILFGRLSSKPLVVHFQGPWSIESAYQGESPIAVAAKKLVERAVYRRAGQLIVLSGAFRQMLVENYSVSPWLIRVLAPGVDLAKFRPRAKQLARKRLGLGDCAFVVLSVRRLVPRTGISVLLGAWAQMDAPRDGRVLLIAGDGPMQERLRTLATQLGISENIRFLGRLTDQELSDYYNAASVTVVPSIELEGFGLTVLESLASGTPVIGTDVGGLPEVLRPLDPSLAVPARDPEALAMRLTDAQSGRRPLPSADECRAYAEQFSWDCVAARTLDVYKGVLDPPKHRKPRVVYLDHCAQLSGAELALLRTLPALSRVDAHVVLGEDGPLSRKLRESGVSTEVFRMPRAARRLKKAQAKPAAFPASAGFGTLWYVLRLARRLRQLKPDLVHTNSLKAAIYGGLASRLAGIPCVWHIRDRITPDHLPNPAISLIRWLAPRLPSSVIANSNSTLITLELPQSVGSVIPSPIIFDPVQLASAPCRIEHGDLSFVVGMVGRIAPWKGQHVFIDAFSQAFPSGNATAVVVGAPLFGEDQYAEQVRARAAGLGLNGRVQFVGFQDDVVGQLSRLDVLVHASILPEPFGQVVIEGMAAGLPVIATGAGGPAEIIEDGVTGMLYEPGNADALAQSLRQLAADPALRKRLGEAARCRAGDFAPEIIAGQLFSVYRALLERSPNSSQLVLP